MQGCPHSLQRVFSFESSLFDSVLSFSYGSRLNEAFSSRSVQTGQQAPRSVEQLHWIPISWPPKEKEKRWEVERGRERECRSRVKARQGKAREPSTCYASSTSTTRSSRDAEHRARANGREGRWPDDNMREVHVSMACSLSPWEHILIEERPSYSGPHYRRIVVSAYLALYGVVPG
jgi:hypothetical protein